MKKILIKILFVCLICYIFSLVFFKKTEPIIEDLNKLISFAVSNSKETIDKGAEDIVAVYFNVKNEIYVATVLVSKEDKEPKAIMLNHVVFDTNENLIFNDLSEFKNYKQEMYQKGKIVSEENIYDYMVDGEIDIFRIFTRSGEIDYGYVIKKGVMISKDNFRSVTKTEKKMMATKYINTVRKILNYYKQR